MSASSFTPKLYFIFYFWIRNTHFISFTLFSFLKSYRICSDNVVSDSVRFYVRKEIHDFQMENRGKAGPLYVKTASLGNILQNKQYDESKQLSISER